MTEIHREHPSSDGSLLNFINQEDSIAVAATNRSAKVATIQPTKPSQSKTLPDIFSVERFERFVGELPPTRYLLLPFISRRLNSYERRQIFNAYLIENGFYQDTEEEFHINFETGEIILLSFSMLNGALDPQNEALVMDFINSCGFLSDLQFSGYISPKAPSLEYMVESQYRFNDTAFFDVFKVGAASVTYHGHKDYATTATAHISHNPFVKDIASENGVIVFNLQYSTRIERAADPLLYAEYRRRVIEKLVSLGIKNEVVLFKNHYPSDRALIAYYFTGDELLSSFLSG